jgi:hypothetical protein
MKPRGLIFIVLLAHIVDRGYKEKYFKSVNHIFNQVLIVLWQYFGGFSR